MEKPIKPGRITALACMLMLLVIVFVVALYKLQIVDGKAYYEENRNSVASSQTVAAARGSILDRYGRVLVSNTSCNNLVFNPAGHDRAAVRVYGHERNAAHTAQGLSQIRRS